MAYLNETPNWETGVYQIEEDDPVLGGVNGIDNVPTRQLANRTSWLKQQVLALGTDRQPLNTKLTALAALTLAADRLVYGTSATTLETSPLTAFARSLLDDTDATSARFTLGAAPLSSPAFTDSPTAPTAPLGHNGLQIANTAFVQAAVAKLVSSAPGVLDTLSELAAALGNDANFSTTIAGHLAGKQPLDATLTALAGLSTAADRLVYATGVDAFATASFTAFARSLLADGDAAAARARLGAAPLSSPAFTDAPTAPTQAIGNSTTRLATTAFVAQSIGSIPAVNLSGYAPLMSPTFTNFPTAPTPEQGNNGSRLATTEFVNQAVAAALASLSVDVGQVAGFARTTPPLGWLKADGTAIVVSTHEALASAIYCGDLNNPTATWGYRCTSPTSPNTSRSVNGAYIVLPDVRAEFVRGLDEGRGVDVGRSLWATQGGAIESHAHGVPVNASASSGGRMASGTGSNGSGGISTESTGGTETRPRNVALLMCIKH